MRSLKLIAAAAAGIFSILSPSVSNAAGFEVHAPKDMVVVAKNPTPQSEARSGFAPWDESCTIPFGTPIRKIVDDDDGLRVLVYGGERGNIEPGHCPRGTVFYLTKDEHVRMEYDYLVAMRTRIEAKIKAAQVEAEAKYQARGLDGEKLRLAILLDEKVNTERSQLPFAQSNLLRERAAMKDEKKREEAIAATY